MSNYVKSTDFASKDALTSGDPLKLIKGTEINTEFNNIQTAVATKADLASPAFTGNPTAATQVSGNNTTRLATTAFVQQEISANEANVNITGGTIDDVDITGGTITGLDTALAVADGGTGKSTLALNNVLLGNGTSDVQEIAPSTSGNVLTSNGTTWVSAALTLSEIGVGQTWQNVTNSRTKGTNYTNSTGKPIMVTSWIKDAVNTSAVLLCDGVTISYVDADGTSNSSLCGIIPNGSVYRINTSTDIDSWVELR
jgi:hypothetical protein